MPTGVTGIASTSSSFTDGASSGTGVYYRFDRQHRQDVFDVCLETPTVTSEDFHYTFEVLGRLIDSGAIEAERARLLDCNGRWPARSERLAIDRRD
jgi:hypothetical protein